MSNDLSIRCACGGISGRVRNLSPSRANRLVCYCDDCQAFASYLVESGFGEPIVDEHGGTDICQMSPAHLEFEHGAEKLACLQLREGGLLRWYASCCHTPIGNTMKTSGLPFVGLVDSCLADADDSAKREAVTGPVRDRVMGSFARGDLGDLRVSERPRMSSLLRLVRIFLMARLRGDQKRSPFFDPSTGEPSQPPHVLPADPVAAAP